MAEDYGNNMDECFRNGISGNCGPDTCPVYLIHEECEFINEIKNNDTIIDTGE